MKRYILAIAILLSTAGTIAEVDQACMQQCYNQGMMWAYCQSMCSY